MSKIIANRKYFICKTNLPEVSAYFSSISEPDQIENLLVFESPNYSKN